MSQSSATKTDGDDSGAQVILLQRGSELSEFAEILAELGIRVDICTNGRPRAELLEEARLVITPARILIEPGAPNLALWPHTIAVCDDASKTLTASLSRTGASMILHRPIHPRALRLLLLHEIYRGPERRQRKRTLIGTPIRIGGGLFKTRATLLELSSSGARIQMPGSPKTGSTLKLCLGKDITGGRALKLNTRVVRCIRQTGAPGSEKCEIGIEIVDADKMQKALAPIFERFAMGPASWTGGGGGGEIGATAKASAAATPIVSPPEPSDGVPPESTHEPRALPVAKHAPLPEDDVPDLEETDSEDRRHDWRIPYERRVVALGDEAARVLVGRDLSHGGMRIVSNTSVAVGEVLRVALHCGSELEPLVVMAKVQRDDGEGGLILAFDDLGQSQIEQLEKIIASSGPIRATAESGAPEGDTPIVVGEMLDQADATPAS